MAILFEHFIDEKKQLQNSLTNIFGIGKSKAKNICFQIGIQPSCTYSSLRDMQLKKLRQLLMLEITGKRLNREKKQAILTLIKKNVIAVPDIEINYLSAVNEHIQMRKVKNEINSKHLHTYQNLLNFNDNKFKNHILFNSKNRNLRKKFIKYYYNKKKLYKTPNTKIFYPINFFSNKKN